MVNLSLKTMVIKKLMLCAFLPLFILSALWNSYYSIISFIATNLSVRESFYFANDVNNKGTHWGGDKYRLTTRRHKLDLAQFKYNNVLKSYKKLNSIDQLKSNFNKEYRLISLLYNIGKLSHSYKRVTALYIPKTLDVYWNLSCDSHMPPFVAPAITNMAMIEGMPMRKNSCYTHFTDHGYNTYHLRGFEAKWMEMDHGKICQKAKQKGFKRIIEINENNMGEIISINHECEVE
tara:strand:- start:322 stop:1023 length:702 start_codon:yes stop_codon:yes gene_type:complete